MFARREKVWKNRSASKFLQMFTAQSLIQGHLTETPSEMAVTPVETANKLDNTSKTDKTDEPNDWDGAHPKTRQQSKATVRGHMCVKSIFSIYFQNNSCHWCLHLIFVLQSDSSSETDKTPDMRIQPKLFYKGLKVTSCIADKLATVAAMGRHPNVRVTTTETESAQGSETENKADVEGST